MEEQEMIQIPREELELWKRYAKELRYADGNHLGNKGLAKLDALLKGMEGYLDEDSQK